MLRRLHWFMLLGVLQSLISSSDGRKVKTYTIGHHERPIQINFPQSQSLEHHILSSALGSNFPNLQSNHESPIQFHFPQSLEEQIEHQILSSAFGSNFQRNTHQHSNQFPSQESNDNSINLNSQPQQLVFDPILPHNSPSFQNQQYHQPPVVPVPQTLPPMASPVTPPAPPTVVNTPRPEINIKQTLRHSKSKPFTLPSAEPRNNRNVHKVLKTSAIPPQSINIESNSIKSNVDEPVLKTSGIPAKSVNIERNLFHSNFGDSFFPTLPPRRNNFPALPSLNHNWPSLPSRIGGFPSLEQRLPPLLPHRPLPRLVDLHNRNAETHKLTPLQPRHPVSRPRNEMDIPPQLAHLLMKIDEKDIPNVNSSIGKAPDCFRGKCSCPPLHKYDSNIGRCIHQSTVHRACRDSEFKCSNGRCVAGHLRCDGLMNCLDGTDEMDCALRNCSSSQFQCADGICIDYYGGRCNNILNCIDGSDEIGCDDCSMTGGCDVNAKCVRPRGTMMHMCKCNVGSAGDGEVCGPDQDLDGYPDYELNCTDVHCRMDNCPSKPNSGQEDMDGDGVGDVCKSIESTVDELYLPPCISTNTTNCNPDTDDDGIDNIVDNCPDVFNPDQMNSDNDTLGDACDNCPNITNQDQEDKDQDVVGDVCDNDIDRDRDGTQDDIDNCPDVPNADQVNSDDDEMGNACDDDADNDGVLNWKDNCWLVPNPDQKKNAPCLSDTDNDGIGNYQDNCPNNSMITRTDFRTFERVVLDPIEYSQIDPNWVIKDNGAEITQTENCDPGLFFGKAVFDGVDFDGTFYIDDHSDDDYAGFVFGYQSNSRFYMMQWKKSYQKYWESKPFIAKGEPAITLKRVNSTTGPGPTLRNAIWHTGTVPGQTEILWTDPRNVGWEPEVAYRWQLLHRPQIGLIRLYVLKGADLVADSGNIFDSEIKGGRLGVFVFSQEDVIWSNIGYKCNDKVRQEVYDELPVDLQSKVNIDYWW